MVNSCSAFGCTNRYSKCCTLNFHRFPINDSEILKQWLEAVRRKNFVPKKSSVLCSDHFIDSDYQIRPYATKKLLKPTAVPSVFKGFPKHLYKSPPVKRHVLQKCISKPIIEDKTDANTLVCYQTVKKNRLYH